MAGPGNRHRKGKMEYRCALVLVLCIGVAVGVKSPPDNRVEALELSRVTREVDLSSPLVKQKVIMAVENKGSTPVTSVLYMVEPQLAGKVGYITAQVSTLVT